MCISIAYRVHAKIFQSFHFGIIMNIFICICIAKVSSMWGINITLILYFYKRSNTAPRLGICGSNVLIKTYHQWPMNTPGFFYVTCVWCFKLSVNQGMLSFSILSGRKGKLCLNDCDYSRLAFFFIFERLSFPIQASIKRWKVYGPFVKQNDILIYSQKPMVLHRIQDHSFQGYLANNRSVYLIYCKICCLKSI